MPVLLIAIGVLFVLLASKKALAFVNGQPVTITLGPIGDGLYLRSDAAAAFVRMVNAARNDGVTISPSGPRAAFRSPDDQMSLINESGSYGSGGLAASVGYSPHQAGIAIDLAEMTYDSPARLWMNAYAGQFAWVNKGMSYQTTKEPWHWEFEYA